MDKEVGESSMGNVSNMGVGLQSIDVRGISK